MDLIFASILNAKRKRLFGSKPVFEPYQPATDLANIEATTASPLPAALKSWLLTAGYGDINETLSFRSEWFSIIEQGELKGHVIFAQDILGNFYTFDPVIGSIHFFCRSAPEYARLATHFEAFLDELVRRNFQLEEWIDSLSLLPSS